MKPTSDELRKLYVEDGLTQRQIGEIFGVAHISVGRWLKRYGIPAKPSSHGLAYRGIEPPTKDDLIRMVHKEFLTYEEISSKYGADRTAVYHWLKKHGIERLHQGVSRTKGRTLSVDHDVVRTMYDSGESLNAIGDHYGMSHGAIRSVCKKAGIKVRPQGFSGNLYVCGNGTVVRSTYEIRVANWLIDRNIDFAYETSYPLGSKWKSDFRANGWFIEIWGVRGNKSYESRKKSKIRFCEKYKIPLIQLEEWHFSFSRGDLLTKPLSQVLTPVTSQGMLF